MISERQLAKQPEDVGIDSERLEALFTRARRDVEERLLSSVQIAVARNGNVHRGPDGLNLIFAEDAEFARQLADPRQRHPDRNSTAVHSSRAGRR